MQIPPADPFIIPRLEPFPDEPGLSPPEEISECEGAKLIRGFICSVYEERYPNGCNFWSGRCRGIRDICELAQEGVEENCSLSGSEG